VKEKGAGLEKRIPMGNIVSSMRRVQQLEDGSKNGKQGKNSEILEFFFSRGREIKAWKGQPDLGNQERGWTRFTSGRKELVLRGMGRGHWADVSRLWDKAGERAAFSFILE